MAFNVFLNNECSIWPFRSYGKLLVWWELETIPIKVWGSVLSLPPLLKSPGSERTDELPPVTSFPIIAHEGEDTRTGQMFMQLRLSLRGTATSETLKFSLSSKMKRNTELMITGPLCLCWSAWSLAWFPCGHVQSHRLIWGPQRPLCEQKRAV